MKKLSITLVILLGILGALWYFGRGQNSNEPVNADLRAITNVTSLPVSAARDNSTGARPLATSNGPSALPAFPNKSTIYKEYENAKSLREFVAQNLMEGASPEGKMLAIKAMQWDCKRFGYGTKSWRDNLESRVKPNTPEKLLQMSALDQIEKKCGGDWGAILISKERANEILRAASQSGSSAAEAYLVADSAATYSAAELTEKVGRFLASNDLATIEQAMRAINVTAQHAGVPIPLANGANANPNLFTHATNLALCDLGWDCGAGSLETLGVCAVGRCDVTSLEDYVRLHSSTPSDFREITELRQLIASGLVASGNKENVGLKIFSKVKR